MSQVAWKNERNVHSVTFIRLIFFPHRTGRTQGIPTGRCISTVSTVQTNTCACQRLNMWRRARPESAFNPRLVPYAQGKKERSRGRNGRRCNFEVCCTKKRKKPEGEMPRQLPCSTHHPPSHGIHGCQQGLRRQLLGGSPLPNNGVVWAILSCSGRTFHALLPYV